MSVFQAILLGIVQGLTEFLPVSSSGHLVLTQLLLGLKNLDRYILFDLVCHLGTLAAIFIIFFQDIKAAFANRKMFVQIILGTLPLVPLVLIIHPIKSLFNRPEYLCFFFWMTSALLFAAVYWGRKLPENTLKKHRWRDAIAIGLFQAVAILPGVSRSGSTIAGARLLGWPMKDAIRFSFLLAIPAILGASAIELLQIMSSSTSSNGQLSITHYLAGFSGSLIVGYYSLKLLISVALKNRLDLFAWYCLAIGLFAFTYLYF